MKHFVLMCLLLHTHTSQSEIHHQNVTEGADAFLYCKNEGKVLWSKGTDRSVILTASKEEIQKPNGDPQNRYSVMSDLDLQIKNVSLSDSGVYFCNVNTTVNLTVTTSGKTRATTSSNGQNEATTTPTVSEIFTSTFSAAQTNNPHHNQPNSTQALPASTENRGVNNRNNPSSQTTTVTSTTDLSTTSTRPSTRTEANRTNGLSKSNTSSQPGVTKPPDFSQIAAAVSGGVVFVVLVLLLWACIKRKDILAALSKKKDNVYETVDDSDFTAQPVPSQKPNDAIYYLAGDPDIVKRGQIQETDDNTYTLISQSKENTTEQEQVPLYSTINEDTINQP